jgi:N-acetylglucosaminyldiphosphoundecaprenol N-acetyl-beta-D-mannosaminyltransferase
VFLGLNFPKQEKLGMHIAASLGDDAERSALVLLLGASYEFYFGLKPRAPRWMRRYGLEWLHRFMQEPLRLWKRYTVDNLRFIGLALKELFRSSEKE